MADEQVSILITAVDDVSKKLDVIKKNVSNMSSETAKQTATMTNSFDKAQGSLLVLGSTAARVDSIFDSYRNMQLRVENASTRVYEASKNVRDAQYALNKTMQDGSSSAEDVAKAQDDLDTASNRLQMSQNNLERTNNAVTGTYIQMGMSIVTVLASIPNLITAIKTLTMASLAFMATPLGLALTALAVVVAGVSLAFMAHAKAEKEAQAVNENYNQSVRAVEASYKSLHDEVKKTSDAMKTAEDRMRGIAGGQSKDELENLAKIADLREQILTTEQKNKNGGFGTTTETFNNGVTITRRVVGDTSEMESELAILEEKQNAFEARRETLVANTNLAIYNKHVELGDETSKIYDKVNAAYKLGLDNVAEYVKVTFNDEYIAALKIVNDNLMAADKIVTDDFIARWGAVQRAKEKGLGAVSGYAPTIPGKTTRTDMGTTYKFNDFIQRPGQNATVFSPDDTVIGVKDPSSLGGGRSITVNITGNLYGVSADDIAQALDDKLRYAIRG